MRILFSWSSNIPITIHSAYPPNRAAVAPLSRKPGWSSRPAGLPWRCPRFRCGCGSMQWRCPDPLSWRAPVSVFSRCWASGGVPYSDWLPSVGLSGSPWEWTACLSFRCSRLAVPSLLGSVLDVWDFGGRRLCKCSAPARSANVRAEVEFSLLVLRSLIRSNTWPLHGYLTSNSLPL